MFFSSEPYYLLSGFYPLGGGGGGEDSPPNSPTSPPKFAKIDLSAAFPNLSKLATILEVLPVTTATIERSFSSMKLVKTRLRSRMGEDTLQHTMRICIEGPDILSNEQLDAVLDYYKGQKKRRIAL